ncbi:thioesterase II family protein [Streptomyces caatingaensis]|uniref:Oleoyl-ACP hydrolase n=1 Tax=Streptomyces caatingaensis TaxID=1678637 RepID=A0A0K9XBZ1_9ACTN|nr:alpha/beta fold hydrolase [Streptomyces caatingaensis]KNB50939.1 oleoyl-ACP hydrolase [Streptomyces caatingaensis]
MTTTTANQREWLRSFHPAPGARVRLVCFPHAGGSASYYFPVSASLAPEVDVVAVQYPGRQDRRGEPCVDDIGRLADRIDEVLTAAGLGSGVPYAFFGHSMGAVLAFEVALRRERRGGPGPVRLFASGRRAPGRFRDERVHQGSDAAVVEEMRLLGGTDSRWLEDEELMAMVLPVLRADYRAIERYRAAPGAGISAPVTVLTGDADPRTSAEEAAAWGEHTDGECAVSTFSGGHFFLERHQGAVLDTIRRGLAGVR